MLCGWWEDDVTKNPYGAFIYTRTRGLVVGEAEVQAVPSLAQLLTTHGAVFERLHGPAQVIDALVSEMHRRTAVPRMLRMRQTLYQLRELRTPGQTIAGSPRLAREDEHDLLSKWFFEFTRETGTDQSGLSAAPRRQLDDASLWVWEYLDEPVALVGAVLPRTASIARITPVFTPECHRRHGFARATVAYVATALLQAGFGVVLFADTSNTASVSLYRSLGFLAVEDYLEIRLTNG